MLSPPLLRPIAWSSPSFLRAGAVLVGSHDRAVDHRVLVVGIVAQLREHARPDAAHSPTAEAGMCRLPWAETFRQVAPRDTGAIAEQHRLDEPPIVLRRDPDMTFATWQQMLDPLPLVVAQSIASHLSASLWPTRYESRTIVLGNPLIGDRP